MRIYYGIELLKGISMIPIKECISQLFPLYFFFVGYLLGLNLNELIHINLKISFLKFCTSKRTCSIIRWPNES